MYQLLKSTERKGERVEGRFTTVIRGNQSINALNGVLLPRPVTCSLLDGRGRDSGLKGRGRQDRGVGGERSGV